MRRAVIAALVVVMTLPGAPGAAADFDSAFAGESAFLMLSPGQSGTFTVFFVNTGTLAWSKGTATQVDLSACLDDQMTCDLQDPSEAPFNPGTWPGAGRYAIQTQTTIAPGAIGTFSYDVKVPASAAAQTRRFNGDLVVSATARKVHPEGYYQDLTVTGTSCLNPTGITASPTFAAVQVGMVRSLALTVTCSDGAKAAGANVTVAVRPGLEVAGNANLDFVATTDTSGVATATWTRSNPGQELVTASIAVRPSVQAFTTIRWVVPATVLTCSPTNATSSPALQSRLFAITAKHPNTGQALAGTPIDITVVSSVETGTATINNTSIVGAQPGQTVLTLTTDGSGNASFVVSGRGATIQPRVFWDENSNDLLGTTEFRADCGATTLER